ncbi:uncharacterized protein LOC101455076 [Ceratitis capitata]|uniref:uncharacterized protein LOC101455076 n=1 Tax=Ceratitis capitata TaxID=7213 RepID=UPI0006188F35|nr:uncharacterized protein LOC101455076 [Ceratitis capitata]
MFAFMRVLLETTQFSICLLSIKVLTIVRGAPQQVKAANMKSTISFVLLLIYICILFITTPQQAAAAPRVGIVSLPTMSFVQYHEISPDSLVPHKRVKRVKRDAFDIVPDRVSDTRNGSERVKDRFPVWDDAKGEPVLD